MDEAPSGAPAILPVGSGLPCGLRPPRSPYTGQPRLRNSQVSQTRNRVQWPGWTNLAALQFAVLALDENGMTDLVPGFLEPFRPWTPLPKNAKVANVDRDL